jgi:hypothetical protein
MLYKVFGYLHAQVHWRLREIQRLAGETGQGTVEYVGLILLVSLLMVGMVAAMKGFNRYLSKGGYYQLAWTRRRTDSRRPAGKTSCGGSAVAIFGGRWKSRTKGAGTSGPSRFSPSGSPINLGIKCASG